GADRADIMHLQEAYVSGYRPMVTWNDSLAKGRPIQPQTLKEIERDYLRAWYVKNNALSSNTTEGLKDYYTKNALRKLEQYIRLNDSNKTTIQTTTLSHDPSLKFYSADGSMVIFDDYVSRYSAVNVDDEFLLAEKDTTAFAVMMLIEDGFWRVRHMEQLTVYEGTDTASAKVKRIFKMPAGYGVNYYPQETPWDMWGERFDAKIITKDFERIDQLGLKYIRIFIPYESFGGADVDAEKLIQLRKTLDLAEKQLLKVIVTLFDFYGNYAVTDWTQTQAHANQIVNALKDHSALHSWDVKNEPDLDFENRGKIQVLAWLEHLVRQIHKWDPVHPVTIGWASPEAAVNLHELVDVVSFHYYKDPKDFQKELKWLKKAVDGKPVVLQEYGFSSYGGIWNAFADAETKQLNYYKEINSVLKEENIPALFWTLYDFENVPRNVVGGLPWRKAPQKHFGLLNKEGDQNWDFDALFK
ncbi:MAG: glycoside hydrolase family 2 TIM barrel-domain containing protein, partial [Leeuwenhoekiella sp.]